MREIHSKDSASAAVRAELDHPVIDADAHILECEWAVHDFIRQIGGPEIAARFEKMGRPGYSKAHRSMFWAAPSGKYTIDRATCMLPKLYAERLADAGIDFAIVYTTYGISANQVRDDEMRRVLPPRSIRSTPICSPRSPTNSRRLPSCRPGRPKRRSMSSNTPSIR